MFKEYFKFVKNQYPTISMLGLPYFLLSNLIFIFERSGQHILTDKLYEIKHQKIEDWLHKRLSSLLSLFNNETDEEYDSFDSSRDIYICWFQGYDNAPDIVKLCINSVVKNNPDRKVHIISDENLQEYIEGIPAFILDKYEKGVITRQTFTDILRSYLLYRRGGVWCDATVFMSQSLKQEIDNYSFYSIHGDVISLKFVSKRRWTGYFLSVRKGDIVMRFLYESFCSYYAQYDKLLDYWLIDAIINYGYNRVPRIKRIIDQIPLNNADVSLLYPILNKKYDEEYFNKLSLDTYIFKLDWRIEINNKNDSYYAFLSKKYL